MKIIILGAGVVGVQIASQLISEGKDVVLIEKDNNRAKKVSSHLDCLVINESGNNIESLKRAGIDDADIFISVTDSDEVNMITCGLVSSSSNVPVKIARVRNLAYSGSTITESSFLGITYIVNSEVETARQISNIVALGADSDVILFDDTELQLRSIIINKDSYFNNRTLKNIGNHIKEDFLVAGIVRDDNFIIPSGDTVLHNDDIVYMLSTLNEFTKIFIHTGKKQKKIERIVIAGGGQIGSLVATYLLRTGRKITIIENNYRRCKELSEILPDALVINGDITGENIFEDEKLGNYDLIITATDNQELNILAALYAKSRGTQKSIALITKANYLKIASGLDIDTTVSPKNSTVDAILKYVRKGNIKSVHTLFDSRAEVIEYTVPENSPIAETEIKDIPMPPDTLILAIIRDYATILPRGNLHILAGDSVIVIASNKSIKAIENLFTRTINRKK